MRVGDLCSRAVATVAPGASLREAALAMRNAHVGALVVVQQKDGQARPVGIVTDRDIVVAVIAVPVVDVAGNLRGMLSAEDVLRAVSSAIAALAGAFRRAGEREKEALHRLGEP